MSRPPFLPVFPVHAGRHCRVGVHHIAGPLIDPADRVRRLLLRGVAGGKVRELFLHGLRDRVAPLRLQAGHQRRVHTGVPAADLIDEPLQVAGYEDVHGRGCGQLKRPVPVVRAGPEEVKEHPVLIGGADQLRHRQPHLLCVVRCQDVAEIPGGNRDVDLLSRLDLPVCQEFP